MTAEVALAVLVAVVLVVWLALARANRIDLLHQKVTRMGATLDAQLLRRAGLAAELASSGLLDPASALLVADAANACLDEAHEADLEAEKDGSSRQPGRATLTPERGLVESELSRVLRQAIDPDDEQPLVNDVVAAWRRAALARRFYNEAVAQVRRIRVKATVRWLRLAGGAPLPRMFEVDDGLDGGWSAHG